LSTEARQLAQLAAAIGRGFGVDLLVEASERDEALVTRSLDELWHGRIVRELDLANHYDFTHDKLREVAYAGIGPPQRRLLHRRIAAALEKMYADAIEPWSGIIAAHYGRAGLLAQGVEHYQRAAAVAHRTYANEDAIELLCRALALLEQMAPD